MKNQHYKQSRKVNGVPSADPVLGQPETATDMINKYGTYNIQPTCDNSNAFPKIAQGLPKIQNKK